MAMAARLLPQTGNSVIVFVIIQKCEDIGSGLVVVVVVELLDKEGFYLFLQMELVIAFSLDFQTPLPACHSSLWFRLLLVARPYSFLCFQNI
jgi:hypothetical protein